MSKDEPRKRIDPLTREEIQVMLKATSEKKYVHWYPLFLCAPRAGIREGELVSLKGIDVDFNGRFIHVQRNLFRGKISATKSGRDRKVDMSAQLAEVLSELLSKRRAEALRREMEKPAEERRDAATVVNEVMEGWLFQTPIGTQIDPSNLRKLFNRLLTDAKMRRVRFHDLRHTFAKPAPPERRKPRLREGADGTFIDSGDRRYLRALVPGGNRQAVDRLDDMPVSTKKATTA